MPTNNGVVPHNQPPIHERHQNLTALLASNSPQKDGGNPPNMQTSMGGNLLNSYSGPGPGPYPNSMMSNGPSMGNYVSSAYNTVSSGYMNTSGTSQMYSQTTPSSAAYSLSSSMPPNMGNSAPQSSMNMQPLPPQQTSAMYANQPMHQSSNMGGMMNGPTAVNNSVNRMVSNNTMSSQPSQPVVGIYYIFCRLLRNCIFWCYLRYAFVNAFLFTGVCVISGYFQWSSVSSCF